MSATVASGSSSSRFCWKYATCSPSARWTVPSDGRLLAQQHAQQRRLAAAVRAQKADARARADEQIHAREDRAAVVRLADAARLDQPARTPLRPLKLQADRPRLIARRQLVDLLRDVAVAGDARLLLGRARGGAPPQPLRLAAQRVSQHDLAPLLRVHRLRLDARVGHVVAVDGQQPAGVARIQLQDARRDPLQEQPIVRHRDRRRPVGAAQQRLQPLDALDVQVVRRLVEQQQVGAPRQLAPERDPLLPAARQRRDRRLGRHGVAGASRQRQPRQDVVRRPLRRPFLDRGADRQVVREPRHLFQQRHPQPALARHRAAIGRVQPGQDPQQRRLPRAVRPDEPDALALGDGEAHAFEQGPHPERGAEVLRGQQDRQVSPPVIRFASGIRQRPVWTSLGI